MPEQLGYLKKLLLPYLEKEAPVIEREASNLPSKGPIQPEVLGEGTSAASPSDLPAQDADVLSQQSNQGPTQPQLTDQSGDLSSKWKEYLAGGAGAAGLAGGIAYLASRDGSSSEASKVPPSMQKLSLPGATIKVSGDESAPVKSSGKGSSASDEDESIPSSPESLGGKSEAPENIANLKRLQQLQADANDALSRNNWARIGSTMATSMGGFKNPYDAILKDQAGQADRQVHQYGQQVDFQKQDPNSAISQQARALATKFGMKPNDQTSAAELEKMSPLLERLMATQEIASARRDASKDRLEQYKMNEFYRRQAQDTKNEQRQDAAVKTVDGMLESARGAKQVGQAETDIYNANKALELKNLVGGDWNKANPQMVKLFVSEIGKIAAGGVSSQAELAALTPTTLRSRFASAWQELSNHPTPAQLGAFMNGYEDYAKGLKKVSQNVLTDRYGRILNVFGRQLRPEDKAVLEEKYLNRFVDPLPGQPGYHSSDNPLNNKPVPSQQDQSAPKQGSPQQSAASQTPDQQKQVVRKAYNKQTNQTQFIYDDGSKAIVDGQQ